MTVGRPRKIEPDIILEDAMKVFWEKGYDGATLADIMRATGMHKGSLYQTFGDKKSLFMAALGRYLDDMFSDQQRIIKDHNDPIAAIRAVLFHMIDYAHSDQAGYHHLRGCMAVNSLVDSAPYDEDICALLEQKKQRMIESMVTVIQQIQAQKPGQLKCPVDVVIALIGVAMEGLSLEMKNNMDPDTARALLDQQLQLLGI